MEPNPFIGRERELGELARFLAASRALTLCGPGGIGKTRLAQRLLPTLAGPFPDGVWLVELGDITEPDHVVGRVAATVGVDGEPGRPLHDTLADAISSRTMLLALDNCEHLLSACARLCQSLLASSPGLSVIATSREPLRMPGEAIWQVPPLSLAPMGEADPDVVRRYEAPRLFMERAGAARPGFTLSHRNARAVAGLCRALDGLPLAIELAAARMRALTAEQIAGRLGDRFGLLRAGDRTAPPRQQTLRATIDWSYSLLTAPERALLRRLSVFAGWTLEMAEEVCADGSLPAAEVLDVTAALVDKSLVVVEAEAQGRARYRLLDTVRDYAAERLAAAGETSATQRRLRDYTLRFATHAADIGMGAVPASWREVVEVFRRYDTDADNARLVLSRCLAAGDAETGLRIITAVRPCWIARGAFAEGSTWFRRFLALDAPDLPPAVRGAALIGRAQLVLANDPAEAESWASEGLATCQAAGERAWTATALNLLAEAALHGGRTHDAIERAAGALAAARAAGDAWNEGYALGTQAALAAVAGRLREAQELGEDALSIMRGIDQQWGVARTLLGLGALARLRDDPEGALRCYTEALPALREIDSRPDTARCLAGIGRVALESGDLPLARENLAESLRLSQSTGARIGVARGLEAFAALAAAEKEPERAVLLTAATAALRGVAGVPPLSGARTEKLLAPARGLGEQAIARLWAEGAALSADAAVQAALDEPRELPVPRLPPAPTLAMPPALTAREREIVTLLARGYTNRAIAGELFISPATAARHVANILAKLDLRSRAQVAAWARGSDPGSG